MAFGKKKAATSALTLVPIQKETLRLRVVGNSPLILNRMSDETMEAMLDKHMGKPKEARAPKDPAANFNSARHRAPGGRDGIPAIAFKAAIVRASTCFDGVTMPMLRGAMHINQGEELLPIFDPKAGVFYSDKHPPRMRQDMTKNANGNPDIRHRPEYWPWAVDLRIVFAARLISEEQIATLLEAAGHFSGVGAWRPNGVESTGVFGTFEVFKVKV